jgi:hypothetical protein
MWRSAPRLRSSDASSIPARGPGQRRRQSPSGARARDPIAPRLVDGLLAALAGPARGSGAAQGHEIGCGRVSRQHARSMRLFWPVSHWLRHASGASATAAHWLAPIEQRLLDRGIRIVNLR